ncbi:CRE-EKL-5 protein [Caenorhabditis remanei]|uniref:CRE-EKL-5 protein n=1 Tax=Caenorhabditis remanei TaxID=31234 RepID=E3MC11_CAERE|nr:CRE-EKL-5 protein [Caenorhabditis remanei]
MAHIMGVGGRDFSPTQEQPPRKRKRRGRLTDAEKLEKEKRQKDMDNGRHAAYLLTNQADYERSQRDYLIMQHGARAALRPDVNAMDSDDEEERWYTPYRFETEDMLPTYVKKAYREREYEFFCLICQTTIKNKDFLDHVPTCAQEKNAQFEDEAAAIALYKSSDQYLNQELSKLRERMELEYLHACLNPERRLEMACGLCDTLDEHKAGMCMHDFQKTAFRIEANKIVQSAISELFDFWELKKQSGLNQISVKYAEKYEREKALSAEQANLENGSETENDEETPEDFAKRYIQERIDKLKAENHSFKRGHFEGAIDKHYWRMRKYIRIHISSNRLRFILQFRKKNNLDRISEERDQYFNRITPAKQVDNRYSGRYPPSRFMRFCTHSPTPELIV